MLNICTLVVRHGDMWNILVISVCLAEFKRLWIPAGMVIYGGRALITSGNMVEESYFSILFVL